MENRWQKMTAFVVQGLIRAIGRRITEVSGEARATNFLRQRLSMAVQRGNAASILSCLPKSKALEEIYLFK